MTAAIELPLVVKADCSIKQQMKRSRDENAMRPVASLAITQVLPESILQEMLAFLTLDELLVLEDVDASWRHAIDTSAAWHHLAMRHEQDADKLRHVVKRIAMRHGNRVRRLEIINCNVSDAVFVEYGRYFTTLKQLVVSGCKNLQDSGFTSIMQASRMSIVEIRAVRCPMLTDNALEIANQCHGNTLQKVDFSNCRFITSAGVASLVQEASQLQWIGLKGCPKVNDSAVATITFHCPQMRSLLLGGSGQLSDASLVSIADSCPSLEVLDIARSNPFGMSRGGISDESLAYLLSKCRQIQQLILRGQGRLTPSSLVSLATNCSRLQTLDIGGCRGIVQDPVALCALLKKISHLEQLSVSFCGGMVDDHHVTAIASECLTLKKFEVDGETISTTTSS